MRQYPIWCDVDAPNYKSDKSFGTRDYTTTDVKIGTSRVNSFDFVKTEIKKSEFLEDNVVNGVIKGPKLCYEFEFLVDGEVVKKAYYDTRNKEVWFMQKAYPSNINGEVVWTTLISNTDED